MMMGCEFYFYVWIINIYSVNVINVFSNDVILWFARGKIVYYGKAQSWQAYYPSGDWVSYCKMRGTLKEIFKSILDAHHAPLDLILLTLARPTHTLSEGLRLHFALMCGGVSDHHRSQRPFNPRTLSAASLICSTQMDIAASSLPACPSHCLKKICYLYLVHLYFLYNIYVLWLDISYNVVLVFASDFYIWMFATSIFLCSTIRVSLLYLVFILFNFYWIILLLLRLFTLGTMNFLASIQML